MTKQSKASSLLLYLASGACFSCARKIDSFVVKVAASDRIHPFMVSNPDLPDYRVLSLHTVPLLSERSIVSK